MLARLNYPGGILVERIEQPELAIADTRRLIDSAHHPVMFEAAFEHAGAMVRADIMAPIANGWRMVEVKSSGSVKDHHLLDCAVQLWVAEGAGGGIEQVCLAHVDTGFEYAGGADYRQMIIEEDVTEQVRALLPEVPQWLDMHRDILNHGVPSIPMGSQCKDCSFTDFCEQGLPEYPVTLLPNANKVIADLQAVGIEDVRDIPVGMLKSERHIRVWQATCDNKPFIDPELAGELAKLPFPRFYLDFETINFVVPRWVGTRPHQQLPFQWSCHIERPDAVLEHREFLETSVNAPMRAFAESLIAAVEADGPIIVYGTFEETILKQLIEFCPDLAMPLREVIDRLSTAHCCWLPTRSKPQLRSRNCRKYLQRFPLYKAKSSS